MSSKELIQGSEEWFAVRRGKITASRLSDLMKKTKYGESTYKTRRERAYCFGSKGLFATARSFKSSIS